MTKRGAVPDRIAGFTLVEVVIAVTMFAIVLLSLGKVTLSEMRQATQSSAYTFRNAEVARQVNRLSVLPFDSLASRAGCVVIGAGSFPHTRCIVVSSVTSRQLHITLTITPANVAIRPDTTIFDRTDGSASSNPFGS